jgi:hypothetical protein
VEADETIEHEKNRLPRRDRGLQMLPILGQIKPYAVMTWIGRSARGTPAGATNPLEPRAHEMEGVLGDV